MLHVRKYILGCAVYCDILAPCVILLKVMQFDHLDILEALTAVLWTVKETEVERVRSRSLAEVCRHSGEMSTNAKNYRRFLQRKHTSHYVDTAPRSQSASRLGCSGRVYSSYETSSFSLLHRAGKRLWTRITV